MASYTRTLVYLSEGNVNGVAVGNTLLTRTRLSEGALQFHPFQVFCKVITATNVSVGATINVGTNSPNFNNIISGQVVAGPARTFEFTALANPLTQLPIDTDINVRVTNAATGASPVLTFRVAIVGLEV
jgi:hypothetical protein